MLNTKTERESAKYNNVVPRSGELFKKPEIVQKPGIDEAYQKLLKDNKILFTIDIDLVKELIGKAYKAKKERGLKIFINQAIRVCRTVENKHFLWFARLLENHMDGIISHATMNISSGKVKRTNNRIKTLRSKGYSYPDDDCFLLKIRSNQEVF
ncbi:MAG: transposase [Succinivibrionaceae bacterium]